MAEVMYPVGYISHVVAMEYDRVIANWNYGQGNRHHGQSEWNTMSDVPQNDLYKLKHVAQHTHFYNQ